MKKAGSKFLWGRRYNFHPSLVVELFTFDPVRELIFILDCKNPEGHVVQTFLILHGPADKILAGHTICQQLFL